MFYPFRVRTKRRFSRKDSFNIWHCQIVITFQPCLLRILFTFLSLALFFLILCNQNTRFVKGIDALEQPLCPCQKQPLTNITVSKTGRTKSGVPGKFLTFDRNLMPSLRKHLFIILSGNVLRPLILDIISLLFFFVIRSAIFRISAY